MLRTLFPFLACLLLIPSTTFADTTLIEKVAQTYASGQSELNTYQSIVNTDQVGIMLARMTTNMPDDAPRPQVPELRKFWSRETGRTVILPMGNTASPICAT